MNTTLASLIDHTLLRPDAVLADIETLCREAREHRFYSVCIQPYWITTAQGFLAGSDVKICTVAGFPLGANMSNAKATETRLAVEAGADEIDMVMNIGAALEGHWNFVEHEIHEVVSSAQGRPVKVILETCLLAPGQITLACQAAVRGGASFVKTSTGFSSGGATVDAVRLMRETVGPRIGVKASGGIRDRATAEAMVAAGATRLGTSASVAIETGAIATATY
jgi:deoxyribose-phosphate aldolase